MFLVKLTSIFLQDFEDLGCYKKTKHKIDVGSAVPIKQGPRRVPFHFRDKVWDMIEDIKQQQVIEPSSSPWSSPVVLVKKNDGGLRFCVEFRKLNDVTIKDAVPLPLIEDLLNVTVVSSWFSTVDLKCGYWQIQLDEKDKENSAFVVGSQFYQFTVNCFGLCNAPATFIRAMNEVFHGLIGKVCVLYLDDIIVFGKTFEEHLENLELVFSRLAEANLKANPKKCQFFQHEVLFLGHVVTGDGFKCNPDKINDVLNWPIPVNETEVEKFLGLCNYYRKYVSGFAVLAKPLNKLIEGKYSVGSKGGRGRSSKNKFEWNEDCQVAFLKLKEVLCSSPVLGIPIPEGDFILDTDASDQAIGATLSQIQDQEEGVIAYFSRFLNKAENCVTMRELLAVVRSVEYFRHYLLGRKFLIRTDHASLKWLLSFKSPEGQVARWLELLFNYDFEIEHRPGKLHGNADALSQRPCTCNRCEKWEKLNDEQVKSVFNITCEVDDGLDWKRLQEEDLVIRTILEYKFDGRCPEWQDIAHFGRDFKIYLLQ